MGRAIAGVVGAFVLWTVLWLGFSQGMQVALPGLVDPLQPLTHTGVLLTYLAYSVVISVAAGYACAAIRGESPMKTVRVFAIVLLVVGIAFETSSWALTPVWYHLTFLALLVPATVWGGSLRG